MKEIHKESEWNFSNDEENTKDEDKNVREVRASKEE